MASSIKLRQEAQKKHAPLCLQHSLTIPTSGYRKPAPTLARMSRMGRVKPVGTPFCSGLWDKDRCVLAMQMGRFPKPWGEKRAEAGQMRSWCHSKEHLGIVTVCILQFTWNIWTAFISTPASLPSSLVIIDHKQGKNLLGEGGKYSQLYSTRNILFSSTEPIKNDGLEQPWGYN